MDLEVRSQNLSVRISFLLQLVSYAVDSGKTSHRFTDFVVACGWELVVDAV